MSYDRLSDYKSWNGQNEGEKSQSKINKKHTRYFLATQNRPLFIFGRSHIEISSVAKWKKLYQLKLSDCVSIDRYAKKRALSSCADFYEMGL